MMLLYAIFLENLRSQNIFTELASTTLFYRLIACNSKMFLTLLAAFLAKIEKISKYNYARSAIILLSSELKNRLFIEKKRNLTYMRLFGTIHFLNFQLKFPTIQLFPLHFYLFFNVLTDHMYVL